jgi:CRP-like cAMP-binding protein
LIKVRITVLLLSKFELRWAQELGKSSDEEINRMHNLSAARPATEPLSVGLFKGLGNREICAIRTAATKRTFEASQIIKDAEQPAMHLFLVEVGYVDYFVLTNDGREILLRRLVPGNAFGCAALLTEPNGYFGTARAVHKTEMLLWEHRVVRQLAAAYPRLVENALHASLHYLALYAKRHIRLVSNTAQEKVAHALTNLGSRTGHVLPGGVEVDIKNEDLASLADVNFYTVSRILAAWESQKVVSKSRGKVLIRCPERMLAA